MDELANSLTFIIKNEINKVLDDISINFNINRDVLNIYTDVEEFKINKTVNNLSENLEIPVIIVPDECIENNIELKINHNVDNKITTSNNTNNLKCKQMTRKGKQCDYNCKPNSEYCGRHSK
jgi:hypothetical protein